MKTSKKILAVVLASLMSAALCVTSLAANDGSITIQNAVKGTTYDVYKIFDATYVEYTEDGETLKHVAYSYTDKGSSDPFLAALQGTGSPFDVTARTGEDGVYNVSKKTSASDSDVTAWINTNAALIKIDANKEASTTASAAGALTVSSTLPYGYYYFNTTTGGTATITSAVKDVTVKDKNTRPGPGPEDPDHPDDSTKNYKYIVEDGEAVSENNVEMGETVDFRLALDAANYINGAAVKYYIAHDKISDKFDIDTDSIKVYVNGVADTNMLASTAYEILSTKVDADCAFEVKIPWATEIDGVWTPSYPEQSEVYVTYSATLKNTAVVDTAVPNEGWFTNDIQPTKPDNPGTTETYTRAADIVKTDASNDVLTGAEFLLYSTETGTTPISLVAVTGGYRIATEDDTTGTVTKIEAGNVKISGLGNGSYWLEETKAPTGYNPVEERIEIVINGASLNATVESDKLVTGGVQVINQTGGTLPETGGIGTTIFYIVGGLLAVGAALLLITKKRLGEGR